MLIRLLQILAFTAVAAAFIFSSGIKEENQPVILKEEIQPVVLIDGNQKMESDKLVPENISVPVSVSLPSLPIIPIATTSDAYYIAAQADSILESDINLQSIVLVRCIFRSQYFDISSQPWGEERINVGTGTVISGAGLILTVKHILDISEELLDDPAGREWKRIKCDIALTDREETPITSIGSWGQDAGDDRFRDADIVFVPDDSDYKNSKGFDLALLKIRFSDNFFPNSLLFPYLINFKNDDPAVFIGYPGRESASPQELERFDGKFIALTSYKEALCVGVGSCGLRYVFRRYPYDYEKRFWEKTELGIITSYFRGGFSGAPVFYKGNLIGIVTHGISGSQTKDGWDQAVALTSWDIFEFLKRHGAAF